MATAIIKFALISATFAVSINGTRVVGVEDNISLLDNVTDTSQTLSVIANTLHQSADTQTRIEDTLERVANTQTQIAVALTRMATTQTQIADALTQMSITQTQIATTQTQMATTQTQMATTQTQMAGTLSQVVEQLQNITAVVGQLSTQNQSQQLENVTPTMTQQQFTSPGVTVVDYTSIDPSGNTESNQSTITINECNHQLGMEDGSIQDSQITASSEWSPGLYLASYGRLNRGRGYWCALIQDDKQWLQINLGVSTLVSGIILQGVSGIWVTKYKVQYGHDVNLLSYIKDEHQNDMVFEGNFDGNTPVTSYFPSKLDTMFIKIHPTAFHSYIGIRCEILGCAKGSG